jgi:hypothetical protein
MVDTEAPDPYSLEALAKDLAQLAVLSRELGQTDAAAEARELRNAAHLP